MAYLFLYIKKFNASCLKSLRSRYRYGFLYSCQKILRSGKKELYG